MNDLKKNPAMGYVNAGMGMLGNIQGLMSDNSIQRDAGIGGLIGGGLGFLTAPFLGPLGPMVGQSLGNFIGGAIGQNNAKWELEQQQKAAGNIAAKKMEMDQVYRDLAKNRELLDARSEANTSLNKSLGQGASDYFMPDYFL